jgi:hypothetical protein
MPTKVKFVQEALASYISENIVRTEPQMAVIARNTFNARKNLFLKGFNENAVTKELEAGRDAPSSLFEGGSLFAFIGFEKSKKPIDELRTFFNEKFIAPELGTGKGVYKGRKDRTTYTALGFRPSIREIAAATRRPWDGVGSWALEIEEGTLPNFAHFLPGNFDDVQSSRSGRGLEIKPKYRSDNYSKPASGYLKALIKEFDERF